MRIKDPLLDYHQKSRDGHEIRVQAYWSDVERVLGPYSNIDSVITSGDDLVTFTGATVRHTGHGWYSVRSAFPAKDGLPIDLSRNADAEFAALAIVSGHRLWAPTPGQPYARFKDAFKALRVEAHPEVAATELDDEIERLELRIAALRVLRGALGAKVVKRPSSSQTSLF